MVGRCEDVYQVRRSQIDIQGRSQTAQHLMDGGLQGQGMITVILVVKEGINTKTSQEWKDLVVDVILEPIPQRITSEQNVKIV